MKPEEAVEHIETDPNLSSEEKEFSVGFSKQDDKATIHTSIRSQIKRMLQHTDIHVTRITCYNENLDTYTHTRLQEYNTSDGSIVSAIGKVPIESLKIQSSPRSQRSYAQIISPQTEVSIN